MKNESVKIIFLDIDGVLCTTRSQIAFGPRKWDQVACGLIKNICKYCDYKIVCSSSWRFDKEGAKAFFEDYGLNKFLHPDWTTVLKELENRGQEIQQWIDIHNVDDCLIIDDNRDMLESQMDRLILTNPKNGLTTENYEKMVKLLKL